MISLRSTSYRANGNVRAKCVLDAERAACGPSYGCKGTVCHRALGALQRPAGHNLYAELAQELCEQRVRPKG